MNVIQCFGPDLGIPWAGGPNTLKELRMYFREHDVTSAVVYRIVVDEPDLLVATRITYQGDDISVWIIT